jgi:hypothetical protein
MLCRIHPRIPRLHLVEGVADASGDANDGLATARDVLPADRRTGGVAAAG